MNSKALNPQNMLEQARKAHRSARSTEYNSAGYDSTEREWFAGKERRARDYAFMIAQLRPARPDKYAAWLKGYLLAGGWPTHVYDNPMLGMWRRKPM